ncbi:hypothetical protein PMN64_00575 [Bradyrhizobium sp. UFLA01-814]|uniref:hypothetical protein n=1 Tax=Bradyrhizobium sp. UFLA01-814 TaxID=3023480 RepID=UPI00398B823A
MNAPVKLRVPYDAIYIPYRHRNRQGQKVASDGHIVIESIAAIDAPISHRIVDEKGSLKAEVRLSQNSYWWVLKQAGRAVSPAEFASYAERESHLVLATLGCGLPYHSEVSEEKFFASKPRVVKSTKDDQWKKARVGASKVVFCDSTVLVAAGPPVYYGIRSGLDRKVIDIEVGPSELDLVDAGDNFRERGKTGIYGPTVSARRWAAKRALAIGPHELDRERHLFDRRDSSVRGIHQIEELLPAPPAGPQTCARALAEWLWRGMRKDGDWDSWPWIRPYVPCLADADGRAEYPHDLPHRRVLEDFAAVDWTSLTSNLAQEAEDAREILRRLDLINGLDEDDDAALGRLGF